MAIHLEEGFWLANVTLKTVVSSGNNNSQNICSTTSPQPLRGKGDLDLRYWEFYHCLCVAKQDIDMHWKHIFSCHVFMIRFSTYLQLVSEASLKSLFNK